MVGMQPLGRCCSRWVRTCLTRLGQSLALIVAFAALAEAAPARVALVHAESPQALHQRTLTRLRAELVAAGFEVTDVVRTAEDAREAAEAEPPVPGVFATVVIVPRTPDAADIWVADRITGKTVVRRVQGGAGAGNDVATILAVRAVELLQASLLEAVEPPKMGDRTPTQPLPADVANWMEERRPRAESRFALEAGLGALHSFDGVGPAFLPVLGLSYRVAADLSLGVRAAGPAFASDVQAPSGSVAVRQELVSLAFVYHLPTPGPVRPFAMLGAGLYHLDALGTARAPYEGRTDDLFAAVFDVGIGARLALGPRVSLLGDVRTLLVTPKPIIRAAGQPVASVSQPSLLGEVAVQVGF